MKYFSEWKTESVRWKGRVLTGKQSHFCPDWDYPPIDETCIEIDCCTCPKDAIEDLNNTFSED